MAATVLLSRGADVNRRDRGDNSPLELALVAGHEEVASALRLGGAQTGLPGPRVVKADALRCGGGGGARV